MHLSTFLFVFLFINCLNYSFLALCQGISHLIRTNTADILRCNVYYRYITYILHKIRSDAVITDSTLHVQKITAMFYSSNRDGEAKTSYCNFNLYYVYLNN